MERNAHKGTRVRNSTSGEMVPLRMGTPKQCRLNTRPCVQDLHTQRAEIHINSGVVMRNKEVIKAANRTVLQSHTDSEIPALNGLVGSGRGTRFLRACEIKSCYRRGLPRHTPRWKTGQLWLASNRTNHPNSRRENSWFNKLCVKMADMCRRTIATSWKGQIARCFWILILRTVHGGSFGDLSRTFASSGRLHWILHSTMHSRCLRPHNTTNSSFKMMRFVF